jgi:hypothetical protein
MRKIIAQRNLPDPIPREEQTALLRDLEKRLTRDLSPKRSQLENVRALNTAIVKTFASYDLEVQYAGPYGIIGPESQQLQPTEDRRKTLEDNPLVSNPLVHWLGLGIGCENLDIRYGVVGDGITGRESLYVPSVLDIEGRDPDAHTECRQPEKVLDPAKPKRDMSEFYVALIKPATNGKRVVQEGYDLDVLRPNVFSEQGAIELERIITPALEICFPGPIEYEPVEGVHYRPLKNGEAHCEVA